MLIAYFKSVEIFARFLFSLTVAATYTPPTLLRGLCALPCPLIAQCVSTYDHVPVCILYTHFGPFMVSYPNTKMQTKF
jgi:hypothetical protein